MFGFLNTEILNTTITFNTVITTILVSFVLGLIISFTYIKTNKLGYSQNLSVTLVLLPILISTVILLIGSNIAGAFSLAGIFSIIRFRSAPGNAKDISYILFCTGAGLACGVLAHIYGVIFTIAVCGIMFLLNLIEFGKKKNQMMVLKILIPEDLDFENTFDEILKKYTTSYFLRKTGTKDLGSIYELVYDISIDITKSRKEFLDEIRCRNGNLNISLNMATETNEF